MIASRKNLRLGAFVVAAAKGGDLAGVGNLQLLRGRGGQRFHLVMTTLHTKKYT